MAIAFTAFFGWELASRKDKTASEVGVDAANRVIRAYYLSKLTGNSNWLDLMEKESNELTTLSIESRLAFYTVILRECELFAATSLHFFELVGNDAKDLKSHLQVFEKSPQFSKLDADRKRRIRFWIGHLTE